MSLSARKSPRLWLIVPMLALGFLAWSDASRIRHIEYVTAFAGGADLAADPASPTGHAGGLRPLVAPERDAHSLQWIVQTQEMQVRGTWRIDRVGYDNAPNGREVWSSSPYRWWLAAVGRVDALITGRPVAASIERAALWADPLLHGLLLLAVAACLLRWAGAAAAAWGSLAVAGLFPLGAAFFPGRPDELGLALACGVVSVLPIAGAQMAPARRGGWVKPVLAGVAGGLGLWVNVHLQAMLILGIVLGGCASAWRQARGSSETSIHHDRAPADIAWRTWAIAGAVASVAGWLAENAPAHLSLGSARWDENHPIYALAWLGAGEVLTRVVAWARHGRRAWNLPAIVATGLALAAVAVLPVLLVQSGQPGFLGSSEVLARVSDLPGDAVAGGIAAWFAETGVSLAAAAALLPVVLGLVVACLLVLRRSAGAGSDATGAVVFSLGPVVVALVGSFFHPGDWIVAGAMLVVLVGPACLALRETEVGAALRATTGAGALACVLAGAALIVPRVGVGAGESVSTAEVQALVERDLAWWLASQAPERDAIVLAPPELTAALIYHGGLRGLGSPYRENEDGFRYSVRLAAATTPDEGQALVESRGVRYIVVPSWDDFLDQYARLGANQPEKSLIALLHQWLPPRWLRAIPYQMPAVEGFANQSVAVFEVVDVQDNPTALSRLAEYFLETGQMAQAGRLAAALEELMPTEPAAFVARAQVAVARRDAGGFREIVEALLPMLEDGSAESLTWDRRVSLALVLAQARRPDLARAQAQRCLDELDEPALRSLTNLALQRYLALLRAQGLEITDPELRQLALRLLPPEMRPAP